MTIIKNKFIVITLLGILMAFSPVEKDVSAQESNGNVTHYAAIDKVNITSYDENGKRVTYSVERQRIYNRNKQLAGHRSGDIDSSANIQRQQVQDTSGAGDDVATDKMPHDNMIDEDAASNHGNSNDLHLPTIEELFALMDFSCSVPSGFEGSNTSGLILFRDTGLFNFEYVETNERITDAQSAFSKKYLASIVSGYHLINDDDTIGDSTADLMWSLIDSDINQKEVKNNDDDPGHSDWSLTSTSNLKRILDYCLFPDMTGSAVNGTIFNTTSIYSEAGQNNDTENILIADRAFIRSTYFSSLAVEETGQEHYWSSYFNDDATAYHHMDSPYNINIFTIDTQGSISSITGKIQNLLP